MSCVIYVNGERKVKEKMQGVVNSQFTPQSKIYLLKNVPIDAMNNTFWGAFDTQEKQFNFFMNNYEHIEFSEYTYQRKDGTVVVNGIYDDLRLYNYLIYQNGDTGNKSKWIYCFISSIGYLNDNCSSISFETDVIQTWRFEIEKNFLPSYIAYEHRPQVYKDENSSVEFSPCINTQVENIEIGTDMVCTEKQYMDVNHNIAYAIIAMTCDMSGTDSYSHGVLGSPSPLNYYVLPFSRYSGTDVSSFRTPDGGSITITPLTSVLNGIRTNEKLVGKCVSITIANYLYGLSAINSNTIQIYNNSYTNTIEGDFNVIKFTGNGFINSYSKQNDEWMNHHKLSNNLMTNYGLTKYDNTKLLSYPYSYISITDNNGTSCVFKNELWDDYTNIDFKFIGTVDGKYNIIPKNYKIDSDNIFYNINFSFESSYGVTLPIISDTTAVLMQSARNSMNVGLSNIVRSNETSSAIASATGNAMTTQTNLQNDLNLSVTSRNANLSSNLTDLQNTSALLQSGINSLGGVMGNLMGGDVMGAIGSSVSGLTGITSQVYQGITNQKVTSMTNANNLANANASASVASQSTAISNQLRQLTTNYQNQTNIQNAMDSYNAKIHDATATADSIVTGSNDGLRIASLDLMTPILCFYKPTQEYIDKLNNIWNVRGYATNTYDYPNLHSRYYWNYIQTVKCNIKSDGIDPSDLEKIKRVFDNGVTLWHTKDVCNYSKSNNERYGVTECDKYGNYKEKKVH